ncbi:uncharacterized protein LOC143297377 [Babylonia areolata]|uniref:uncharacterized protein LOC143297377 n=1 Tax=Babylonia areolata TaxID=304850 RepID=UPI003FD01285
MGNLLSLLFSGFTNPEVRVRQAAQCGRWQVVAQWLGRCDADTQRWALSEGSQRAEDEDLKCLVEACCPDDQRTLLMTRAVGRALWNTAAHLLQQPDVPDTLRSKAVTEACRFDDEDHFIRYFLPHCTRQLLDTVLVTMVNRGLWEGAERVLRRGVSDEQRERVIAEAGEHANETVVLRLLRFCTASQREVLLALTTRRRFWKAVTVLLETETDYPNRGTTVEQAGQYATEDELFKMIPFCCPKELDVLFVQSVMRGMWRLVGSFLERGVIEGRRQWAMEEAHQRASHRDLDAFILPRYSYDRLVPLHRMNRYQPDDVQRLLRKGGISDVVMAQVIMVACRTNPVEQFLPCLKDLSEKQFLSLLSEFIKHRMESHKLMKIVSRREELNSVYQLVLFWGCVFVQSLTVVESQPQELADDFNWAVFFHGSFAKLCIDRMQSLYRLERDKEELFRRLITEWTRSAESQCLKEGFELGVTDPVIEDLFIQCFYRRHNKGAFMTGLRCLLALQTLSSSLQRQGREKLKEVWEEVRRSVFKTAVEHKDWAVVRLMADQSLYDNQRGWATVQAMDAEQWDVVLVLSQHSMTDDQLYRVHRQYAKRADWSSVLRLFQSGADLTHVREDLEMAIESRERPPRREASFRYRRRLQRLRELEDSMAQEAQSLSAAVKQNNWPAVLFRLRRGSSQRQRDKVLRMATQRRAWHVLPYLIRMGISQEVKNSIFPECLSHGQWGIVRLLMEKVVEPELYVNSFDFLLEQRQWILVGMVMDLALDDARRREVMRKAMWEGEGSVVAHGIALLEGRLSTEERTQLFHKAMQQQLWQVLVKLAEESDSTGARHRDYTLREAVWRRQWEVVSHCQEYGADIDARKDGQDTLFNRAARECDWEIVRRLLQHGADQNITDSTGSRAIHRAIDVQQWDVVELLIKFHAHLSFRDPNGLTPLYKIIRSTLSMQFPFPSTTSSRTVAEQGRAIRASLLWTTHVDYRETCEGKTALHVACQAGLWDSFRWVVSRGADPLARTDDGQSLLWMATDHAECPRQLVAACLRLGVSTFEQETLEANFPSTPFGLSVLRQDHVLMAMLHESGSCSSREVFWHYSKALRSARAQAPLRSLTRPGHPGLTSPGTLRLLARMATQPRSLKSLCRLRISGLLGVRKKREKRVGKLPVSYAMKDYVMFQDLAQPEFADAVEKSLK